MLMKYLELNEFPIYYEPSNSVRKSLSRYTYLLWYRLHRVYYVLEAVRLCNLTLPSVEKAMNNDIVRRNISLCLNLLCAVLIISLRFDDGGLIGCNLAHNP